MKKKLKVICSECKRSWQDNHLCGAYSVETQIRQIFENMAHGFDISEEEETAIIKIISFFSQERENILEKVEKIVKKLEKKEPTYNRAFNEILESLALLK